MCGIGALYDPGGGRPEEAAEAMLGPLRHRGPDGDGTFRDGPALLVHTRLAIIDVEGGHQPLVSEDGRCAAVVNGEIYNHRELRAELESQGHRFATRSDSEVVLHAYEQHGLGGVRRLNGIFTFALWDGHRRRLVLARDPFGVKPLYWRAEGRGVAAASEVGALRALDGRTAGIDRVALDHYLAWRFVPAPRTLFEGISKLAPASMLLVDTDGPRVTSYREPPEGRFDDASPDELAAELQDRLVDAIGRQMMSDVPYGAFLSGGVDSAAIAASMRRAGGGPPQTFTIGFPGHGDTLDERAAAAATAAEVGTEHRATVLREGDFPAEVARTVRRLEEPCGTASAPAALELSRFTRESVKVVLSGQGADEPLAGYPRHQAAAALGALDRVPGALAGPVRATAGALPRTERAKRLAGLLGAPAGLERLLRIFEITPPELRLRLSPAAEPGGDERAALARGLLADVPEATAVEQALYLDSRLFLPDSLLLYGDKTSMAWGLEQRVPFLDLELMRFVERLPGSLRLRRMRRKWLYRRAMRGLVPESALRRRKHPFATPYDEWLRTSLGAEVERRFAPGSELAGLARPEMVSRLVAEHRSGRSDNKRVLYCLLELAEWHRAFVEEREPAAAAADASG